MNLQELKEQEAYLVNELKSIRLRMTMVKSDRIKKEKGYGIGDIVEITNPKGSHYKMRITGFFCDQNPEGTLIKKDGTKSLVKKMAYRNDKIRLIQEAKQ